MTPEEFFIKMALIDNESDPASGHLKADNLLCELLIALGYEKGIEIYQKMKKWYS